MLKVGDKLICKTRGVPEETEFCIRGEVLKIENGNVTISRALKFGTVPMKNLTLPEEKLFEFYIPMEESKKIGITERGDASIDYAWHDKLNDVGGVVLITKNVTDTFIEKVMSCDTTKTIVHATCTGFGGSILEPNVPFFAEQLAQARKLVDKGFPIDHMVIRVDPIIPSKKGLQKAKRVLDEAYELGFKRFKISMIDMYPHVRERFVKAGLPLPYGENGFSPTKECLGLVNAFLNFWGDTHLDSRIETCCEEGITSYRVFHNGCISEFDMNLMGIHPDSEEDFPGYQRKGCLCYKGKTELLNGKTRCPNGCLYCYWKDTKEGKT